MAKLTKKLIDSLAAKEKDIAIFDSGLHGFGVRVRPSGRKTFIVWYRNAQGRARKVSLGTYGTLTVDQARKMAQEILGEVAGGHDPAEGRLEDKKALTLKALAARYLTEHAGPRKKPRSVQEDQRMLRDIILPALGRRKLAEVTRQDITRLHQGRKRTPIQANRVLALLSKMFNLAERWGLRPDGSNPCRHVEKFKEARRERYLSGEELARLGQTLRQAEAEGQEMPAMLTALRLLIFTGMRKSEVLGLRWSEVDLEAGLINLADSKTGRKTVALSGPAVEVLKATPRLADNPYVCPGLKPGAALVGLPKAWGRIAARAGLKDCRLHDLRHHFGSAGAMLGVSLTQVGALLGHREVATTKRYSHLAAHPLRQAADRIASEIAAGLKAPVKEKVVALRKKA